MHLSYPISVLLYHGLPHGGMASSIGPEAFCAHLDWLRNNGWRSLTLAEFEAAVTGRADVGKRRFLLTFDDNSPLLGSYASEMKSRGFSGVAFIITGKFLRDENGWLTLGDARNLVRDGTLEVHSHTHRHVVVGDSPEDLEALASDLRDSRAFLSGHLGIPSCHHLAWPWGKCTPSMEATAREIGFDWQYLVRRGSVTNRDKPMRLPRLCGDGLSTARFARILGFHSSRIGSFLTNGAMGRTLMVKRLLLRSGPSV